ncbi:hypothetical protein GCM10009838_50870 [Catenulispora subtropica]|uniref:Secreted protein n=1 Tax=Catenulispora subtropica TaxID=450798 RepID=A0ABP5DMX6_9ACTN
MPASQVQPDRFPVSNPGFVSTLLAAAVAGTAVRAVTTPADASAKAPATARSCRRRELRFKGMDVLQAARGGEWAEACCCAGAAASTQIGLDLLACQGVCAA